MPSFFSRFSLTRNNRAAHAAPPQSHLGSPPSQLSGSTGSHGGSRRELLRVVLRDTLHRHGIPTAWIDAEVLVSTSRTGERGIHWRLVVKHPDARLLSGAVALQNALIKRLTTFDPVASSWLTGLSWQYAFPDDAPYPSLPQPSAWKEPPRDTSTAAPALESAHAIADDLTPEQASREAHETRTDLELLFAARDEDFRRHAGPDADADQATQPMFLGTEPAKL